MNKLEIYKFQVDNVPIKVHTNVHIRKECALVFWMCSPEDGEGLIYLFERCLFLREKNGAPK